MYENSGYSEGGGGSRTWVSLYRSMVENEVGVFSLNHCNEYHISSNGTEEPDMIDTA